MDATFLDIPASIALLRTGYLPTLKHVSHFLSRTADAIDEIDRQLANSEVQTSALISQREKLRLASDIAGAFEVAFFLFPTKLSA